MEGGYESYRDPTMVELNVYLESILTLPPYTTNKSNVHRFLLRLSIHSLPSAADFR